jgi:3-deoxy-D-manno-octulosonic-acid transferase
MASFWNEKARLWVEGRKEVFAFLEKSLLPTDRIIWIHCSSAGEFEQGKPVIEKLRLEYPDHKILISFFSPSGYKVALGYKYADLICYLPLDTPTNATKWLHTLHPELVIFVKYEFWYHYLKALYTSEIPTLLISAVFRQSQVFFKRYGAFYRRILTFFQTIFVQDQLSRDLLQQIEIQNVDISGDTRFDRVVTIAEQFEELPGIAAFIKSEPVLVAGSTWEDDEDCLATINDLKLILAPHEINEAHLATIERKFPGSQRYSRFLETGKAGRVLIIDNIGMLSRLYHYATLAYIGGGFTKDGIHNILEAAVYGKPAIIGPNYAKYREAVELIDRGAAFSLAQKQGLANLINSLIKEPEKYRQSGRLGYDYVQEHRGATVKIVSFIQENRLLTR